MFSLDRELLKYLFLQRGQIYVTVVFLFLWLFHGVQRPEDNANVWLQVNMILSHQQIYFIDTHFRGVCIYFLPIQTFFVCVLEVTIAYSA